MRLPLTLQGREGVREKHSPRNFPTCIIAQRERTRWTFFVLKLPCPFLRSCANAGLVSSWVCISSPRWGHLRRPVADVVPASSVPKWVVWKGIKANIVTSYHLTPWPVPSWDAPSPSAPQGTVKPSPPAGQKNAGGEEVTHEAWSRSIAIRHGHSLFHGERETLILWCWCECLWKALFPPQSWMSVSTFAALAITNKTCQKPEICI